MLFVVQKMMNTIYHHVELPSMLYFPELYEPLWHILYIRGTEVKW